MRPVFSGQDVADRGRRDAIASGNRSLGFAHSRSCKDVSDVGGSQFGAGVIVAVLSSANGISVRRNNVRPCPTIDDAADVAPVNTEVFRNSDRGFARCSSLANGANIIVGQNRVAVRGASRMTAFSDAIGMVVFVGADKEMCRVAAPGHVALMKDAQPFGNGTNQNRPGDAVSHQLTTSPVIDGAVSVLICSGPQPARFRLLDVSPEASCQRSLRMSWHRVPQELGDAGPGVTAPRSHLFYQAEGLVKRVR